VTCQACPLTICPEDAGEACPYGVPERPVLTRYVARQFTRLTAPPVRADVCPYADVLRRYLTLVTQRQGEN
jgi:hypothetical protein